MSKLFCLELKAVIAKTLKKSFDGNIIVFG
jgi:hypothetical protein